MAKLAALLFLGLLLAVARQALGQEDGTAANRTVEAIQGCGQELRWEVKRRGDKVPYNAVWAGYRNTLNVQFYVGRVWHGNALIPAIVVDWGVAYANWRGDQIKVEDGYQVAVADTQRLKWVAASRGRVPDGAIRGGLTEDNEVLYVCRVFDPDLAVDDDRMDLTPGALRPGSGACYLDFYGPRFYTTYEVLVADSCTGGSSLPTPEKHKDEGLEQA